MGGKKEAYLIMMENTIYFYYSMTWAGDNNQRTGGKKIENGFSVTVMWQSTKHLIDMLIL